MEDAKPSSRWTVRDLRALAREHLGRGHSALKTKAALIEALTRKVPALASLLQGPPPQAGALESGLLRNPAATVSAAARKEVVVPDPADIPAEPLIEGFFVARVVGEGEARQHHLTEDRSPEPEWSPPDVYDEHLGELPSAYHDDAHVLLARDPSTAFDYWDFREDTRRNAAHGLEDPKALLRVYDGGTLIREIDVALESRSYYLHGLSPGRHYRVELVWVGRDGQTRLIGRPSNVATLPPYGPSADTTVRFLRIPWGLPIARLKELLRAGQVQKIEGAGDLEPFTQPRETLPHSADWPPGPPTEGGSSELHLWRPTPSGHR
jgi:hypothetical protein